LVGTEEEWDVTGYGTTYGLNGTISINDHILSGIEYR
jgi:hypothetical protein